MDPVMEDLLAGIDRKLDRLQTSVGAIKEQMATKTDIAVMNKRFDDLEAKIDQLLKR